ncbi:MAG: hypothetical protein FJ028_10270 [Chloroflexi bacterium]|nr:hypothetical protein [Chloroflexota bacterium]
MRAVRAEVSLQTPTSVSSGSGRLATEGEAIVAFNDIDLTCKDCGQPFVFTAGD